MKHSLSFLYFSHLVLANSRAQSSLLIRFLLLPLIRSVLNNMHEMEQMLLKTEDINWTVVRPPGLRNLPSSGRLGNSSWFFFLSEKNNNNPDLNPDQWRASHEKPWKIFFFFFKNIPCHVHIMVPELRRIWHFAPQNPLWHSSRLLSHLILDYENVLIFWLVLFIQQ